MEFVFPTAFVSFMMGIAALLVAVVSLFLPQYILLMGLWLIFATGLILISRRLFTPKRQLSITGDDSEATTISGIPAGKVGRVLYEGNSWRAKCADETRDIAPNEAVFVVRRQGNTLIILPSRMIDQE
ncbi:MAG: NfeD family protein [Cyanobacteria bacterium P01_G01_bin.67]